MVYVGNFWSPSLFGLFTVLRPERNIHTEMKKYEVNNYFKFVSRPNSIFLNVTAKKWSDQKYSPHFYENYQTYINSESLAPQQGTGISSF